MMISWILSPLLEVKVQIYGLVFKLLQYKNSNFVLGQIFPACTIPIPHTKIMFQISNLYLKWWKVTLLEIYNQLLYRQFFNRISFTIGYPVPIIFITDVPACFYGLLIFGEYHLYILVEEFCYYNLHYSTKIIISNYR